MDFANRRPGGRDLRRALDERHMGMISLSANIGYGLTIGSGLVLRLVGPKWAIVSYVLAGILCWALMGPFAEMNSSLNVRILGPLRRIPNMFFDRSMGLACGYTFLFCYAMIYANEAAVAGSLFTWDFNVDGNRPDKSWATWNLNEKQKPLWILVILGSSFAVNCFRIRVYGELEYWFGVTKIISLSILIVAMLIVNITEGHRGHFFDAEYGTVLASSFQVGNNINATQFTDDHGQTRLTPSPGKNGCPEGSWNATGLDACIDDGGTPLFAMWTAITTAFWAFLGPEIISVTAAEANHHRQAIKPALRKTLLRIFSLYFFGIVMVCVNVPRDHHSLLPLNSPKPLSSENSPFMIAFVEAEQRGIAHFANLLFIFSTWSCSCSALYVASRSLHSLAVDTQVPTQYLRDSLSAVDDSGVPMNSLYACTGFGLITAMLASGSGGGSASLARSALDGFSKIGTVCWLIIFTILSICFLRYRHILQLNQDEDIRFDRRRENDRYPYRTHWAPVRSYLAIAASALLLLFCGFVAFLGGPDGQPVDYGGIFTNYLGHILFLTIYVGDKFRTGDPWPWASPDEAFLDIMDDFDALTEQEATSIISQTRIDKLRALFGLDDMSGFFINRDSQDTGTEERVYIRDELDGIQIPDSEASQRPVLRGANAGREARSGEDLQAQTTQAEIGEGRQAISTGIYPHGAAGNGKGKGVDRGMGGSAAGDVELGPLPPEIMRSRSAPPGPGFLIDGPKSSGRRDGRGRVA